jgi:amino acid transporter
MSEVGLKRSLSLPLIVLYGLGTIVGAGIYALTGVVAQTAGLLAPLSFLLASVLAGFSAISLAELSSRFPKSAGEAVYVMEGFRWKTLSAAVGLFVILSGLVSSATILNGFVGYLQDLLPVGRELAIIGIGLIIGFIAAIGIGASVSVAALVTLIEVGALFFIIGFGLEGLSTLPQKYGEANIVLTGATVTGVIAATVPAFFAFIGFEDMVNVAEEVKNPRRNLPRAILITLLLTGFLYVLVSLVAIGNVPLEDLVKSSAPLTHVYEASSGRSGEWISTIAIFAMLNGALIQVIMAARVFYGLAQQGSLPKLIGRVDPRTHTPLIATAIATVFVIAMAIFGSLESLARLTAFIILIVFTLVNLALLKVKARDPNPPEAIVFPQWIPLLGAISSAAFVIWQAVAFFSA